MKTYAILFLLALWGLAGACKKEEVPLHPTSISLQVVYKQTGLPVDSAEVIVKGSTGGFLVRGQQLATYAKGYTDKQGRFTATMMIPREYLATYVTIKEVVIGNRYLLFDVVSRQPNTNILNHEQENNVIAQLDTLK